MMNFNFDYNVDMVFCIDATGSMGGLIEKVKDNALNFYQDVQRMMTNKQKDLRCFVSFHPQQVHDALIKFCEPFPEWEFQMAKNILSYFLPILITNRHFLAAHHKLLDSILSSHSP